MSKLVIADTSPINYLVLIDQVHLLPRLFSRVVLPGSVQRELLNLDAPVKVRQWITHCPDWVEIWSTPPNQPGLTGLGPGESSVISLAEELQADVLLIDERKGVGVARSRGLRVTGTLGLLEMAAKKGLVDFGEAAERLRKTSFRAPEHLLEAMIERYGRR